MSCRALHLSHFSPEILSLLSQPRATFITFLSRNSLALITASRYIYHISHPKFSRSYHSLALHLSHFSPEILSLLSQPRATSITFLTRNSLALITATRYIYHISLPKFSRSYHSLALHLSHFSPEILSLLSQPRATFITFLTRNSLALITAARYMYHISLPKFSRSYHSRALHLSHFSPEILSLLSQPRATSITFLTRNSLALITATRYIYHISLPIFSRSYHSHALHLSHFSPEILSLLSQPRQIIAMVYM